MLDARGTSQPCRARENVVAPISGEVVRPAWITGRARKLFDQRIAVYKKRGQQIAGCEEMIAHYCALSADIEARRKAHQPVSASDMNALKGWAVLFYDVSAAQVESGRKDKGDNPFSGNGKPPKPTGV